MLLIDLQHELRFARWCERHQLLAGFRDVARFHAARDQYPIDRRANDGCIELRLRREQVRFGLRERGLCDRVVAAVGAVRFDLELGGPPLAHCNVEVALGVIELRLGDEILCHQVFGSLVLLLRLRDVGPGLLLALLGCGKR